MTPNEAILELEDTYDKELTVKQTAKYQKFLAKFTPADIEGMTMRAIEDCKYLPRIAHLNDARKDLNILQPDRARKPDKDCSLCSGTGWQYVTAYHKLTQQEVKAVERCSCEEDPGPGGVF